MLIFLGLFMICWKKMNFWACDVDPGFFRWLKCHSKCHLLLLFLFLDRNDRSESSFSGRKKDKSLGIIFEIRGNKQNWEAGESHHWLPILYCSMISLSCLWSQPERRKYLCESPHELWSILGCCEFQTYLKIWTMLRSINSWGSPLKPAKLKFSREKLIYLYI